MFNFDGRLGAIGRVPPWIKRLFNVALVRFDIESETPVRAPTVCASRRRRARWANAWPHRPGGADLLYGLLADAAPASA